MKFEASDTEIEILNAQKSLVKKLTAVMDNVIEESASAGLEDRAQCVMIASKLATEINSAARNILSHIDKTKNTMMKAELLEAARNGMGRAAGLTKLPAPRI